MNSFKVVLSLTIAFIIALVANTAKGYMFFYKNIETILLIGIMSLLLVILMAGIFRRIKRQTSL